MGTEEQSGKEINIQYLILVGGIILLCTAFIWIFVNVSDSNREAEKIEMCSIYECVWANYDLNESVSITEIHPDKIAVCNKTISYQGDAFVPYNITEKKVRCDSQWWWNETDESTS